MDRSADRPRALTPASFIPYPEARRQPHMVVDGAPLPSTVLTLSHWPNNASPEPLRRDTSTATAFAYLDAPAFHQSIDFVTSNHFDEDGLFSMYAVTAPEAALECRNLLEAASFAGDFGIVRSGDAARLCFVIEALSDPETSVLPPETFAEQDRVAALYRAFLPLLPELVDDLRHGSPRFGDLWAAQDEHLASSRKLIADGLVSIEEDRDLDLAIVRIPESVRRRAARRYLVDETAAVHPFAINTATACSRILRIHGARYEFEYRYESWVQLASRRVPLRVRLDALLEHLNSTDPAGAAWVADDPTDIVPRLYRGDGSASSIPAEALLASLREALTTAPVAWDPYDWRPEKARRS